MSTVVEKKQAPSRTKKWYRQDFESQFGVKYVEHNVLKAPQLLDRSTTQDKLYTTNPSSHDRLAKQYGPFIEQGYCAKMHIKWINKNVEYGAFADEDIKRGQMVCEYTGILEVDKHVGSENLYVWSYPTIIFERNPATGKKKKLEFCVNAQHTGNFARFINHSLRKYQNVGIHIIPYKNLWHVIYVARQDIKKGQQLLTHYGIEYWRNLQIVPMTILPTEIK